MKTMKNKEIIGIIIAVIIMLIATIVFGFLGFIVILLCATFIVFEKKKEKKRIEEAVVNLKDNKKPKSKVDNEVEKPKPTKARVLVYILMWVPYLLNPTAESMGSGIYLTILVSLLTIPVVSLARKMNKSVNWAFFWGAIAFLPSWIIYAIMYHFYKKNKE